MATSELRPAGSTPLFDLFARGLGAGPGSVAVDYGGSVDTYAQLADRSGRLADTVLRCHGRAPASILLIGPKGPRFYEAYLAACRLGAAVVPIGTALPASRLASVVRQAAPEVALDCTIGTQVPAPPGLTVLSADGDWRQTAEATVVAAEVNRDIAYTLFTSGSTGRPKGVPVRSASVVAYVDFAIKLFEIEPGARLSHTFAVTFDLAVFDMFCAWASGATLCAPRAREQALISRYVESRQLTHWFSVPSAIPLAARAGQLKQAQLTSLRTAMFCGEALTYAALRTWRDAAPATRIFNLYGPTELTISVAAYEVPADPADWPRTANDTVPIGSLHPEHEYVLLDAGRQVSSEGELCVRGVQRFDGYLDPTDGTDTFVEFGPDGTAATLAGRPDSATPYYRSGDRVRVADSTMVYLGRVDDQLKVGGYRIEPGDVESALRTVPGVAEAVVVAVDEAGSAILVAVCTGDETAIGSLRDLTELLPAHLVPSRVLWLPELPLSGHGKVDRHAVRRFARTAVEAQP